MEYYDIYAKRLNQGGGNLKDRMQSKKEKEFELLLQNSTLAITFTYSNQSYPGILHTNKQDETQTIPSLLTRRSLTLPGGALLSIDNDTFMVYYCDLVASSGYNKYILVKMTNTISWTTNGVTYTSKCYFHGPGKSASVLTDFSSLKNSNYTENDNKYYLIMPYSDKIVIDTYFEINTENFRVVGYDIQSTDGVEYITLNPSYKRDLTAKPVQTESDDPRDFFWLNGGKD